MCVRACTCVRHNSRLRLSGVLRTRRSSETNRPARGPGPLHTGSVDAFPPTSPAAAARWSRCAAVRGGGEGTGGGVGRGGPAGGYRHIGPWITEHAEDYALNASSRPAAPRFFSFFLPPQIPADVAISPVTSHAKWITVYIFSFNSNLYGDFTLNLLVYI